MTQTAVPTRMPSRLWSVEKTDGSGLPSGVSLPVSRLSPFMQSSHSLSNSASSRWRITTKDGSPRYEKLEMNEITPWPAHLDDAPLGDAEEADVEIVEVELLDAPTTGNTGSLS